MPVNLNRRHLLLAFLWSTFVARRRNLRPNARGPGIPFPGKLFHQIETLGGEIVQFRAIFLVIVEFPRLIIERNKFPRAVINGAVSVKLPAEGLRTSQRVCGIGKSGHETGSLHGQDGFAVEGGGIFGAAQLRESGHEINEMDELRAKLARNILDSFRPMDDQGRGDAALLVICFEKAEGGIAQIGPRSPHINERGRAARGTVQGHRGLPSPYRDLRPVLAIHPARISSVVA